MKEVTIQNCPYCGGEELVEGQVCSYGGVYVLRGHHSTPLFVTVCRDCGSVVRSYCKDPEKLFPRKERRES